MSTELSALESEPVASWTPKQRTKAWVMAITLTLASICSYMDRQILVLMIEPIQRDLHLTDFDFALLAGPAFMLLYVTMGIPLAWLADRYSRRTIISLAITTWSVMTMACGLSFNFASLFVGRVGVAIGEAGLVPPALSMIADSFPPAHRTRPMILFSSGNYLGLGLAMLGGATAISFVVSAGPITLPLIGSLKPWQSVFMIVGLLGLPVAGFLALLPEPQRGTRLTEDASAGVITFVRSQRSAFPLVILAFATFVLIPSSFLVWAPAVLLRVHHFNVLQIGVAYGCIILLCVPTGTFVGGWILDRLRAGGWNAPALKVAMIGTGGALPFAAAMAYMPTSGGAIAMLAISSFMFGLPNGMPALALGSMAPNRMRARVYAIYFVISGSASALGPVLVAFVGDTFLQDPTRIGEALSLVCGGASLLALVLFRLATQGYIATAGLVASAEQART